MTDRSQPPSAPTLATDTSPQDARPERLAHTFPRPGSSLYHALKVVPAQQRAPLETWLTWWHETALIPYEVRDPGVAEQKLTWWLSELKRAEQGQAQHPLLQRVKAFNLLPNSPTWPEWPLWSQQIEGLIQLVHQTRWLDDGSLQRHARQTTGAAAESAAVLLGATSDAARSAANLLGVGLRQAHQLGRLGQDARAGWVNVAIDVLQTHDVKAHQLTRPDAQQVPAGWSTLLGHLHAQAHTTLDQGLSAIRALSRAEQRALKPLLVLAHIQLAQMAAVAQSGDLVLHQRIVLTPLMKSWISQKVRWGLLK